MNKLWIGGAAAALIVAISPAVAQPAPPTPPGVAPGTAPMVAPVGTPRAPHVQMMMMSPKSMTRDQVVSHVRDIFTNLDSNRDGFLTRDELGGMHGNMAGMHGDFVKRFAIHDMPRGDRGAMFDRLDANHDGSVSRQEYVAAQPQVREQRVVIMRPDGAGAAGVEGHPGMTMRMHKMGMGGMHGMHGMAMGGHLFDMADANKDGRVSLAEAQAAALAHFDRADRNRDGTISPQERQQRRQMRSERRSG